jgi:hypothetical protein
MMSEHDQDGEFASVVWDTSDDAKQSAATVKASTSGAADRGEGSSSNAVCGINSSNGAQGQGRRTSYNNDANENGNNTTSNNMNRVASSSSRMGGTATGSDSHAHAQSGRYWVRATVAEPVKMLEGTKDAYIAYTVKGEVCVCPSRAVRAQSWR